MIQNNQKGFTLLEMAIAIVIITMSLLAVYGFFSYLTAQTNLAVSKLVAYYLAQEGAEIVKNIRDSNLIQEIDWNSSLLPGIYEADYSGSLQISQDRYLKKQENGMYNYISGTDTKYKRKITLSSGSENIEGYDLIYVFIKSEVKWKERGTDQSVIINEKIYDLQK